MSAAAAGVVIVGLGVVWLAPATAESTARQPDINRGAVIAAQGTRSGAPACAQCHAFNGSSDGSGAFPRIAGQSAYYLMQQMRDFSSNVRANAIMSPIAKALSPDDAADVAAYYAGVNAPFLPLASAAPALIQRRDENRLPLAGTPPSTEYDHPPGISTLRHCESRV